MRFTTCTDGVTAAIFLELGSKLKIIGVCLCLVVDVLAYFVVVFFEGVYVG